VNEQPWEFIVIRNKYEIKQTVLHYLNITIWKELDNFTISDFEVESIKIKKVKLRSTLKIPENADLTSILIDINNDLSSIVWKSVELDFEIIRIANIISE
jgi:nitroreductase